MKRQPDNARLYAHVDRHTTLNVPTGRRARLWADGRLLLDGQEVLLKVELQTAKVQITQGNSTFNLKASNISLAQLDLGTVGLGESNGRYTERNVVERAMASNPLDWDSVYPPVVADASGLDGSGQETEWNLANGTVQGRVYNFATIDSLESESPHFAASTYSPQPYLVVAVERVLAALGYPVASNVLRSMEMARRLIVVHAYVTYKLNEILPDWNAADFITGTHKIERVHFFPDVQVSDSDSEDEKRLALKIVPARMAAMTWGQTYEGQVPLPVAERGDVADGIDRRKAVTAEDGFNQVVENGLNGGKDTSGHRLYVAHYMGHALLPRPIGDDGQTTDERPTVTSAQRRYPICYTHRIFAGTCYHIDGDTSSNIMWRLWGNVLYDALWYAPDRMATLSFTENLKVTASLEHSLGVDTSEEHTFALLHHGRKLPPARRYIIGGRSYVCVNLKYQVRNGALLPYVIGTFLPLATG